MFSRCKRTTSPCYGGGNGCTERVVGCHSVCDKYKVWQKKELARKNEAYQLHLAERDVKEYEAKKIDSIKRRIRKRS